MLAVSIQPLRQDVFRCHVHVRARIIIVKFGINTSGDIVGIYIIGGVQHGFVRSAKSRGNQ